MDENTPIDNKRNVAGFGNVNKRRKKNAIELDNDQQIVLTTNTVKKTTTDQQKIPPLKQLEHINQLRRKVHDGDEYLVARPWWIKFEHFGLDLTKVPPGPMDNTALLQEDGEDVRPNLKQDEDYFPLPNRAWVHLVQWYGVVTPHSTVIRKRAKAPLTNRLKATGRLPASQSLRRMQQREIFDMQKLQAPTTVERDNLLQFTVFKAGESTQISTKFKMSPYSTVFEFQTALLNALNLSSGTNIELWLLNNKMFTAFSQPAFHLTHTLLENSKRALHIDTSSIDFDITIADCLRSMSPYFDSREDENRYFLAVDYIKKRDTIYNPYRAISATRMDLDVGTPGLCGLQNLGNTCYMNSALQCLSNTPQLTKWFLSESYKKDINISNPLGLNGELADSFAYIIKSFWSHHSSYQSSISPKDFKTTFERFNPHFIGYQQQDSQELLSFLLDGLHEDLNRIIDKPYIEIPDFDDELADKEVAHCFWNYHKARNDSIIVDLFQGQFKSRLTCDECKKDSVTFDPFMYLSLPLPSAETKCEIEVVYVPYQPSQKQLKVTISLNKEAKIGHLKQEIENNIALSLSSISADDHSSLLVVEMHQGKIFKLFTDTDPVYSIHPSDIIYVYQLRCPSTAKNDDNWIIFPVYCATTIDANQQLISSSQFGFPIVLAVEANKLGSMEDLYGIIVHHIERYCSVKLFEEDTSSVEKKEDDMKQKIQTDRTDEDEIADLLLSQQTVVEEETGEMNEKKALGDKDTTMEDDSDKSIQLQLQQPIDTTATVPPTGDIPMVPIPNLFNIKIFDRQKGATIISKSQLTFPTGSQIHWNNDQKYADIILKQGQGVVIEWGISKAQQVFGSNSHSSSSSSNIYDHDHHSDINTEAWRNYEELVTSSTATKKPPMTTRSSLNTPTSTSTLEDCLNEFTGDERLSNEDLWYCPRCKKHQRASKKFDIWRLPEILVVHLKRFSQLRRWGNKIDTFVDFPISGLDFTDRVLSSKEAIGGGQKERLIYDLYAVDNHYGGMGGGHYTAYAQNIENQCWYDFDDSHVRKIAEKDIKSNAAYLLFYKRRR